MGRTGEYWSEVLAVRTEHSEIHTETNDIQYFPVRLVQARQVSNLLYGTQTKPVYFEFAGFREQKYTAVETVCMAKKGPTKNQSEFSDLPQDYLAILYRFLFSSGSKIKRWCGHTSKISKP